MLDGDYKFVIVIQGSHAYSEFLIGDGLRDHLSEKCTSWESGCSGDAKLYKALEDALNDY